ncbi:TlpA disulfide reductase family protein [Methyloligella sp. 2.7D]|uniref:TlpA family protein disulfide reductase n=1 Tax=unclassified Methyloligella TaxID=2625955 RepID=UPI00157D328C|nr:TlpA disulfide reductase family protein [Methyloligella sp. GL2]QKP76478.1 TlpA family protein disulfide reductase [Methyloligella sp. GL2]
MSDSKKQSGRGSSGVTIIVALIAAIIGFGTIYWSLSPSGNDSLSENASKTAESETESSSAPAGEGPLAGLNKGEMAAFLVHKAPKDLPEMTLENSAGEPVDFADFKGKTVLLNIWATWCHPCREEMPALDKLEAELGGDDFQVVAMNIDRGGAGKAKDFLKEVGADHIALYRDPSGKLFSQLRAVGMPTTLLVNAQGKEIGRLVGPAEWDSDDAVRLLKAAIAADTSDAGEGDKASESPADGPA